MKLNRITSFAALTLAALLFSLGLIGSAPAAAHSVQLSFTAQVSQPNPAPGKADKPGAAQPADQTPYHITVQGRLTDQNGNPITTARNLTFKLYTQSSGGNPTFSEGPISVTPDSQGLFSYQLGSSPSLSLSNVQAFASKLYLGVTIASDAEMAPRFELTAAPYAMSLAPGALISGAVPEAPQPYYGALNVINTASNDPLNAGVYGNGPRGVYGDSSAGAGVYGRSTFGNSGQTSVGVVGVGIGPQGAGGVFTGTSSGVVGRLTFGAGDSIAGDFTDNSNTSGAQTGVSGQVIPGNNTGPSYAGYFHNNGGGNGSTFGIYVYGPDTTGYSGDFSTDNLSLTSVNVEGNIHAGGCCAGAFYDIQVKYHGAEQLHSGDVLALDGNSEVVSGIPTLGVVKVTAQNAKLAIGVAQYRFKQIGLGPNGRPNWQVDLAAASFQSGDLLSAVVLGQARMKVGNAAFGDRLTLAADGSLTLADDKAAYVIGKVANQPDKDGYATVFVNLK